LCRPSGVAPVRKALVVDRGVRTTRRPPPDRPAGGSVRPHLGAHGHRIIAMNRKAAPLVSFVVVAGALIVSGCAAPTSIGHTKAARGPEADLGSPIASIHASKCGACHTPVEPGTRSRPHIEAAMKRHRARARLSEPEWSALVDFLAEGGTSHGKNAAL